MVESSKAVGPWRERVALQAAHTMGTATVWTGPVRVQLEFVLPRPTSLPKSKPTPAAVKRPDTDKLVRAVLDALTGVVWGDDSQVVALHATKRVAELGEQPGVSITAVHDL